jgi:hypothetical protein
MNGFDCQENRTARQRVESPKNNNIQMSEMIISQKTAKAA